MRDDPIQINVAHERKNGWHCSRIHAISGMIKVYVVQYWGIHTIGRMQKYPWGDSGLGRIWVIKGVPPIGSGQEYP